MTALSSNTLRPYHYEQARHERYLATNENNLAFLLYKLGRHADAHKHLDRAQVIEEHGASKRLTPSEVYEAYLRANRLLRGTQDAEDKERLPACSLIAMRRLADPAIHEKNFSLYGLLQDLEAKLIGQALEAAGGSVTKAARILGLSHQTLNSMLKGRHARLLDKRTPVKKRLRSIIKAPKE